MVFAKVMDRIRGWILRFIKRPTKTEEPATEQSNSEAPELISGLSEQAETKDPGKPKDSLKPPIEPVCPVEPDDPPDLGDSPKTEKPQKQPPRIRGRRPSGSEKSPKQKTLQTERPSTPRVELLCRKHHDGSWELILSAPKERDIAEIEHDEEPLSVENSECRLSSFSGTLRVKYSEGETDEVPLFRDKAPLVFKMRNDSWEGPGRKISAITRGHFIVFAPVEWTRTGHVPVEAGHCMDAGFQAHYFHTGKNDDSDEFGGFEECEVPLSKTGFEFDGEQLFDDSEDGGLFVGTVPKLKPADGIVWARAGEERRGGWDGENFQPAEKSLEEILTGRQGRFFIRVYDATPKLVDSGEFRYYENLKDIEVNGASYSRDMLLLPTPDGHSPTVLRFIARNGEAISQDRLELKGNNPHATVSKDGVVNIAPHPDGDEVACVLKDRTGSVDVRLHLPRVWWRLEQQGENPGRWNDRPLSMTRNEFRARANKSAVIKLRLPSRIKSIGVGFGDNLTRAFPATDGLPLESFVDYEQVDNPSSEEAELRIRCDNEMMTLIRLAAASPPPTEESPPKPPTRKDTSSARVKYPLGWRHGKGFSYGELRGAGLTTNDAARLGIPIDKRRQSAHNSNIGRLLEISDA